MIIPTKEEVIWALKNPETIEGAKILGSLSHHPKWSEAVLHRCPLCGYETTVTNICRNCPEAPLDPEMPETLPEERRHMAVPMYVVEKKL